MIINTSTSSKKEVIPDYQEKTVQAATFPVVVTADTGYDALSKATVQAPENLSAGNIKRGVNIAGVVGTYAPSLQSKIATPSEFPEVITADASYDGLEKVTLNKPKNLSAGNIKHGITIAGITGTYTGDTPNTQRKTVTPTSFPTTLSPDSGYIGLSEVTVNKPVSLVAENIAPGKNICGIDGTWEPNLEARAVTPDTFPYTVGRSSDSYDGLLTVTVNAPNNLISENIKEGVTIAGITGNYAGNSKKFDPHFAYWPCIGTSMVTSAGSAGNDTVAVLRSDLHYYGLKGGESMIMATSVDAADTKSMAGANMYAHTFNINISTQTAVLNTVAGLLFGEIDSLYGDSTWTATAMGVFGAYETKPDVVYANSTGVGQSVVIMKTGNSVRIVSDYNQSVRCYGTSSTMRLGFYPTTIIIW